MFTDGSLADAQAGFEQIAKEMRANGITLPIVRGGWSTWSSCWCNLAPWRRPLPSGGSGWTCRITSVDSVPAEYTVKAPFKPERAQGRGLCRRRRSCSSLAMCVRRQRATGDPQNAGGAAYLRGAQCRSGQAASWMSDPSGEWSRTWYQRAGKAHDSKMIHGLLPQTLGG
ncbi:MAG: hypothetical protein ACLS7Z_03700 [Christensenellales bacterium]